MNDSESEVNDLTEHSKIQDTGKFDNCVELILSMQLSVREPVFPVSLHDKCDEQGNTIWHRCYRNASEGSEQIYDLTGAV